MILDRRMKKLRKGIKEIIVGLVGGLLFSAVLNFQTKRSDSSKTW